MSSNEPPSYTHAFWLHPSWHYLTGLSVKRALYVIKRAPYIVKQAIYTHMLSHPTPIGITSMVLVVCQKSSVYYQKSLECYQKSPVYYQESPVCDEKRDRTHTHTHIHAHTHTHSRAHTHTHRPDARISKTQRELSLLIWLVYAGRDSSVCGARLIYV